MKAASSAIWPRRTAACSWPACRWLTKTSSASPRPRASRACSAPLAASASSPAAASKTSDVAGDDRQPRGERQLVVDQRQQARIGRDRRAARAARTSAPEARREGLPQPRPWRCSASKISRAAAVVDGLLQRDHVEAGERLRRSPRRARRRSACGPAIRAAAGSGPAAPASRTARCSSRPARRNAGSPAARRQRQRPRATPIARRAASCRKSAPRGRPRHGAGGRKPAMLAAQDEADARVFAAVARQAGVSRGHGRNGA